jgi:DNA-binding MarR family transcriptional regulator
VTRTEDPADRRVRLVALTDEGRRTRDAMDAELVGTDPALETLDDEEQRTLRDLLTKVATHYRR